MATRAHAGQSKVAFGKTVASEKAMAGEMSIPIRLPYAFAIILLIVFVCLFHVWSRAEVIDLNLEISKKRRELKKEQQEYKHLMLEVASLKSPPRIRAVATDLGMTLPAEQQVVQLKEPVLRTARPIRK